MLLFSLAVSRTASQLKPEILVCRRAALMINVAEERQTRDRKELFILSMLMEAIYTL